MNERPTVTISEADVYFASRLHSEKWDVADELSKSKALSQASFLVSGAFVFSENAFQTVDNTVIWNERIKAGICEEALWLLEHNPNDIPESLFKGISTANAGSVSATFDKSFICPWICDSVKMLIGDLGTFVSDECSLQVTQLSL